MDWTAVLAEEDENKRAGLPPSFWRSNAYASTAAHVQAFVSEGAGAGRRSSTTAVIYFRR